MSIARGRLPLLIICLSLSFELLAFAQSEGEQVSGAPALQLEQAVLIALEHNLGLPADTYKIPGPPTSMLAGRRSTAGSVATNINNRTDTLVPDNPQREIES